MKVPQDITSKEIEFAVNGKNGSGYVSHPSSPGKYPAVVVIQEWWGLDDHIKNIAERFARIGFSAIAPDLYNGVVTSEPDEARKLAMSLDYQSAAKEIDGAANWLLSQPYTKGPNFGCVGYCMGGGLVMTTAIRNSDVAAAVVYYGGLPNPPEDIANIQSPLLALYGEDEKDRAITIQEIAGSSNENTEIHIYQGASHGFFNDTNINGYNLDAAYDSWARTTSFLFKNLT